jgi:hypothetical protein
LSKSAQVTAPHAGGEKKPKRYSFKAYRITNGCKVPVEEKGLFFCPVEDDNGGYLSFFEWMGIERDKAITGKHNEDKVSIYVFFVFGFAVFFILDLVLIKLSQGR